LGRAVGPNEKYDGEGEILTIAVDPASQGRGYGQRLLQDAIVSARKAGAKKMYLEVASDNDVAIALYNKFGFKKIARRKDYYVRKTEVMDALIMEKSI